MQWGHSGWPRWRVITIALVVVAGLAAAWAWHTQQTRAARQPRYVEVANGAYVLPRPDRLADFELVRHDGTPFASNALKGRWSFLIFGYTFCPDFCPTTLVAFNEMHRLLTQQSDAGRDVQFIMVTVDPERDTARQLATYVPQFNPEFIGVTGAAAMIARLADSVGAVYEKHSMGSDGNYLMDHSTAVHLINPQGQLQGVFAPPHVAAEMLAGYRKIRQSAP